ncbi:MAG: Uma2 family endonuclease [Saprospiraceae bacterium]
MRKGDAIELKKMSVQEYIMFEESSDIRHEYFNGQLIPMPGTTTYHNLICQNIIIALRLLLKGKGIDYRVFMENVKVQITNKKDYTYPDVFLTFDKRDFDKTYILEHPSIIFEVSSPSTKVYDKTDKFIRFRKIPSLRHYIVVNSEKVDIEVFTKVGKEWVSENYSNKNDFLELSVIKIKLPITDIYAEVL